MKLNGFKLLAIIGWMLAALATAYRLAMVYHRGGAALARTISFPWILFVLMYVPPGEVYFSGVIAHGK